MDLFTKQNKVISVNNAFTKDTDSTYYKWSELRVVRILNKPTANDAKKIMKLIEIRSNFGINNICLPYEALYESPSSSTPIGYMFQKPKGKTLNGLIYNPVNLRKDHPDWTRLHLAKIAKSLVDTVDELHENEILMGDVDPNKILINDQTFKVFFLDSLKFQFKGLPTSINKGYSLLSNLGISDGSKWTLEKDYFLLAIMIFEIFMPGRHPYYSQEDGLINNIKNRKFAYLLGDDNDHASTTDQWNAMWVSLPFDLRNIFYNIFVEGKTVTPKIWSTSILFPYIKTLENGTEELTIFPSTNFVDTNKTRNMNTRDVNVVTDKVIRNIETKLVNLPEPRKIGVLELSTKAVKLLIGKNPEDIKSYPFDFKMFFRTAEKTNTGRGLSSDNTMDMIFFRNNVLPYIRRYRQEAINQGVDTLYTVATAAYRTAKNREEIINTIRDRASVNVRILTKQEESTATIRAFFHTTSQKEYLKRFNYYMIIDQGGGSTEVSLFRGNQEIKSYSINLGTNTLMNVLFQEATDETAIEAAFKNTDDLIKKRLYIMYQHMMDSVPQNQPIFCVAVGSAITKATKKKGNAGQHDTQLSIYRIQEVIKEIDNKLKHDYPLVKPLYDSISYKSNASERLEGDVVQRLGLPIFVEIMKKFKMEHLTVSGTGLWYGIYFQQLMNEQLVAPNENVDNNNTLEATISYELVCAEKLDTEFESQRSFLMKDDATSNASKVVAQVVKYYGKDILLDEKCVNIFDDLRCFGLNWRIKNNLKLLYREGLLNKLIYMRDWNGDKVLNLIQAMDIKSNIFETLHILELIYIHMGDA